jgi:outer membrane receptor for ferric coprogen and ferric-rhodotorulic acid
MAMPASSSLRQISACAAGSAHSVGLSNYLITNIPELNTYQYNGVELTIQKRMSKGWQVLAGYTSQQQKGIYVAVSPTISTIQTMRLIVEMRA